jgi:hypothetical protein
MPRYVNDDIRSGDLTVPLHGYNVFARGDPVGEILGIVVHLVLPMAASAFVYQVIMRAGRIGTPE